MPSPTSDSPRARLLLAMPNHQLARKGTDAGFRIWSLWDPELTEADLLPRVEAASEQLLLTSFTDTTSLRKLTAATATAWNLDTVLHFGDGPSVLPVIEEAWHLGLSPNPPDAYRRLLARTPTPPPPAAPRLTVETLTIDGHHHIIGITAQRTTGPPHYHLTGYLHPAPLSNTQTQATTAATTAWLQHTGYQFGPAQTHLTLTPQGPHITASRPHPGTDRTPLLAEIARGFDAEAALFDALQGTHPHIPAPTQYAEIGFFPLPQGQLQTYTGTENIAVTPWVRGARFPYTPGDQIPPPTDPRARRAYVIVQGNSPHHTHQRLQQAHHDLITDIRPT